MNPKNKWKDSCLFLEALNLKQMIEGEFELE